MKFCARSKELDFLCYSRNMDTRIIEIDTWARLAKEGCAFPVTIPLNGDSMRPLIRKGKDCVTIVPAQGKFVPGDVVLFTDTQRFVVHRIFKINYDKNVVQTWGDNCLKPDCPEPIDNILGRVIQYERNGRNHDLDTDKARNFGLFWMKHKILRTVYIRMRLFGGKFKRVVFRIMGKI